MALVFPGNIDKELLVAGITHPAVDDDLVAGHVVGDDGEAFDEDGVHGIHVDIDWQGVSVQTCRYSGQEHTLFFQLVKPGCLLVISHFGEVGVGPSVRNRDLKRRPSVVLRDEN